MIRPKYLRTLVQIMMLALAATPADPPPASAAPKSFSEGLCEDLGHGWPGSKDCKTCAVEGSTIPTVPGTKANCKNSLRPGIIFACTCNGKTGQWDASALTHPSTPNPTGQITPLPTQNLPLLQPTPPGPAAPLPHGGTERR